MQDNDYRIVRITNISNFDFTGPLGARYGGRDFFVPAGGDLLCPFSVGDHLATHLARQILIQGAPVRDASETDGKGSDRPLWDEQKIIDLKAKIMKEVYQEERTNPVSEGDRMAAKVADLNKVKSEMENVGGNATFTGVPTEEVSTVLTYKDKSEVIAELEKRGVTFDPRASKSKLEDMLDA